MEFLFELGSFKKYDLVDRAKALAYHAVVRVPCARTMLFRPDPARGRPSPTWHPDGPPWLKIRTLSRHRSKQEASMRPLAPVQQHPCGCRCSSDRQAPDIPKPIRSVIRCGARRKIGFPINARELCGLELCGLELCGPLRPFFADLNSVDLSSARGLELCGLELCPWT